MSTPIIQHPSSKDLPAPERTVLLPGESKSQLQLENELAQLRGLYETAKQLFTCVLCAGKFDPKNEDVVQATMRIAGELETLHGKPPDDVEQPAQPLLPSTEESN